MALISLDEAKQYLSVDSADEDSLISSLILTAEVLVKDVGRVSDENWTAAVADPAEDDSDDVVYLRSVCKAATMYTLAYLFEHREEADHHDLVITLRNLLFAVREGVI